MGCGSEAGVLLYQGGIPGKEGNGMGNGAERERSREERERERREREKRQVRAVCFSILSSSIQAVEQANKHLKKKKRGINSRLW